MAVINQAALDGLYTSLNGAFNAAFATAEVYYDRIAMVVQSSTRISDYKFILQFPQLREWVGDRQIRSLAAHSFTIENRDYEATVEVDRNDIEDDQLGLYVPIVAELGRAARQHPDMLLAELITQGTTVACYDGRPFFDTAHPLGDSTASNYGGGTGTTWYLLDTTRQIRPFIVQIRKQPQLVRQDRPEDEQVFMRKKYRYGVDYRGAVGYGLWQLAYASKQPLSASNYAAARAAMMSLTNEEGVPLGIRPNLLVVPPSLEAEAREILQAELLGVTGEGTKTNIWRGTADLLVLPYLS